MKKRLEQLSKFLLSRNLQLIEVCLIFVLLLWGFCRNLQSVEFQPDETFWIASSVRLDKFLAGDFDSPIWNEPFINYEVRPVPSYIVAIGQRLGHIKADTLPEYWDWGLTKEENISRGAMPSDPALWWSRLPMAVLTAFTFLGVIYFLAKAHSRFSAYIFGVISFNDYFLLHLRRAMSEAPLLFFTILVLYASYKLSLATQEGSLKKIIWWSFIAGVLSGLAGQSKLTGLACTAIPILFALLWLFRPSVILATSRFRSFFIVTTIVLFTSLLIFVVSYPFFYKNTLYRSIGTFYFRNAVIQGQSQTYASDIIPADDRIVILFQRIFEYPISTSSSDLTDAFFSLDQLCYLCFRCNLPDQKSLEKGTRLGKIHESFTRRFNLCSPHVVCPF